MFFVLKLSKLCNLRCTYCYEYEDLAKKARMPLAGLEFFFRGVAEHYLEQGWRACLRFVLHGGEPTLFDAGYLRAFAVLQRSYLGAHGIPYQTSLQTNLFSFDETRVAMYEELGIELGISLDVYGQQRLTIAGQDSQDKVLDNLQRLIDCQGVERLKVGAISVMHALNVERAVNVFRFYNELGLSYRILPIFSITDPPARMRHLMLSDGQVVDALQQVALAQFESASPIRIFPLWNFVTAAVRFLAGRPARPYNPRAMEWALIVDTNGDAYNHAEAYTPDGLMGNVFTHSLGEILGSPSRQRTLALRRERAKTCERCAYDRRCSRVPIVEALPSERVYDATGRLQCTVARPMIEFLVDYIRRSPAAMSLVRQATVEEPGWAVPSV